MTMSASAGRSTRSIESMRSVTAWKRAAIPKLILAGCSARASAHPTSDQETFSYDENGLEAAPRVGHSGGSADRSAANARAKVGRVSSNKAAAGSAVCDGDSVSGTAGQQLRPQHRTGGTAGGANTEPLTGQFRQFERTEICSMKRLLLTCVIYGQSL